MLKNSLFSVCLMLLALTGCTPSCQSRKPISSAASQTQKQTQPPQYTQFSSIDTSRLNKQQLEAFTQFVNEEVCPCDCPQTFAGCLQHTQCEAATLLGQWVTDRLAEDVNPTALLKAVNQEIAGYQAKPAEITLTGFAHKGSDHPQVTIVEFADFECAHCQLTARALSQFSYAHAKDVQVIFKHFPLPMHPMAKKAAIATEAAAEQGRFWQMHDVIFKTQSMINDDLILSHAKALKLDVKRFQSDLQNPTVISRVDSSIQEALRLGLTGTPSIFFNGRPYHLSHDNEGFTLRLKMELARSLNKCG